MHSLHLWNFSIFQTHLAEARCIDLLLVTLFYTLKSLKWKIFNPQPALLLRTQNSNFIAYTYTHTYVCTQPLNDPNCKSPREELLIFFLVQMGIWGPERAGSCPSSHSISRQTWTHTQNILGHSHIIQGLASALLTFWAKGGGCLCIAECLAASLTSTH